MEEIIKIPTGVKRFDEDSGGFAWGKAYLVSGGAHTAKSVFTAQFLMSGLSLGENVLLLTDKKPEDFLSFCADLQIDVNQYLQTGQFVLLKYLFQAEDIIKGEKDLSIMLGEFENFILANRVARVAVDTAVPLFQLISVKWFETGIKIFLGELQKLGVTLFLTSRMPATQKALEMRNLVEAAVAGSIHLDELTKPGGKTSRKMTVRKMNHINPPYPAYEFEVKNAEGIVITSRSAAGLESPREKVFSKTRKGGLSFSDEYKAEEPGSSEVKPSKWKGSVPPPGKTVSFSDKYDVENK